MKWPRGRQSYPCVAETILVVEAKTDLSSSVALTDDIPKSMKFGLTERKMSLPNFTRLRTWALMLNLLVNLLPITLLQVGVGSLFLEGIILMEAYSGSAFLTYWGMMGRLGPLIFCLPILIGGAEGPLLVQTWVVVLGRIPMVFLSCAIGPLTSFQFTTIVYLRTPTTLRVAPVTISLWRTWRTACKSFPLVATPSTVIWLTGGMTTGMIAEIFLVHQ